MKNKISSIILILAAALAATSCMYNKPNDVGIDIFDGTENNGGTENFEDENLDPYTEKGGDQFSEIEDNPFIYATEEPQSTFSVDADGASYSIMRAYINRGMQVTPSMVRIEEFLNYFTFDYPDPTDGNSVKINAEIGDCPWEGNHKLLRLGIKGKTLEESELPQSNYVFMIDVSGSMGSNEKLPLLKKGLIQLLYNLRPDDRISIVTYSGKEQLLLESTPVAEASKIESAIASLNANGATAGASALQMAYSEAKKNYIEGGNNRIIIGTDGDFNVGVTSDDKLLEIVQAHANDGIYLTVCGFGIGNLNDRMMEKISNAGNGTYVYVDSENEMMRVFCHERSQMVAVANDAKVQITFDSTKVSQYRLIGYENRLLSNKDFTDDSKDAGEIGAGQTITALYEIIPTEQWGEGDRIGTFDFRYKEQLNDASVQLGITLDNYVGSQSENLNFAAGVAAYGMILRFSKYKGNADVKMSRELIENNRSFDPYNYRAELIELINKNHYVNY